MCPCNLSFDHGATYDYCRATLVFHVRDGEIEGTDVRGRKLAVIVDSPKVMTEGNWRLGMFVDEDAIDFEVEDIVPFGVESGQPVRFDGMFHPVASNLTMAEAKRSKIDAFGIRYEGKSGLSTSEFSWAA